MITTCPLHDTVKIAKKSTWSKVKGRFSALAIRNWFIRAMFCLDMDLLDDMVDEASLRDEVRDAMVSHVDQHGKSSVESAVINTFNETGYDLANLRSKVDAVKHTRKTEEDWESFFHDLGVDPLVMLLEEHKEVRVVPKFAAAMVLNMRARFGNLPNNEANRLLIEREYLRVCREGFVRDCDIVAHSQCVYNSFFGEGVLDQLATTRVRAPRWLREAFGHVPKASAVVC